MKYVLLNLIIIIIIIIVYENYNKIPSKANHINRNKLDNRICNLRIITAKENSYNRTKNANSENKYKGVQKRGNKYIAVITKDGIKKEIGGFLTEEDAAKTYDMMAEELFGEYAGKNFN